MSLALTINGLHSSVALRRSEGQAGVPSSQTSAPAASALDASGTNASVNGLAVLLGSIGSVRGGAASGPSDTASSSTGVLNVTDAAFSDVTPATRPNLDALNRVLSHYAAQSAAASRPFGIFQE